MRWLIVLIFTLLLPLEARAQGHSVSLVVNQQSSANTCPFGTGLGDGCPQANRLGSIQFPNGRNPGDYLNQVSGTTTNYVTQGPAWNLAGIDYPVGTLLGTTFSDPAVIGNSIPGCMYFPTGVIQAGVVFTLGGNPALNCTTTSGFTGFSGLSFAAQGGHGCVNFRINGVGSTTPVNISNSLFRSNGNCSLGSTLLEWGSGPSITPIFFTNIEIDGAGIIFPPTTGVSTSPTIAFSGTGDTHISYSYVHDIISRPFQYSSQNSCCGLTMDHNLWAGSTLRIPQAHPEWVVYNGTTAGSGQIFEYNTVIQTTGGMGVGDAQFPTQLASGFEIPTYTIDHMFLVPGFAGGASGGASITGGSITGDPAVFTATTVTAGKTIGSGQLITCGSVQFTLVDDGTTAHKTSAGIGGGVNGTSGSTWLGDVFLPNGITATLDDTAGGTGNTLTVTGTPTMVIGIGSTVQDPGVVGPTAVTCDASCGGGLTGTGGAGTYTTAASAAIHTSAAFLFNPPSQVAGGWGVNTTTACATQAPSTAGYSTIISDQSFTEPLGQITNTNNYLDTQAYGTGKLVWQQRTRTNTFNATISGTAMTVSSVTGTAPTSGDLVIGAGIAAQQVIVSGSGTSFVVSVSQTVGPVAAHSVQSYCTFPTIWGGNTDMAGNYNSTLMNQYNATVPGNGC